MKNKCLISFIQLADYLKEMNSQKYMLVNNKFSSYNKINIESHIPIFGIKNTENISTCRNYIL